MRKSMIWALVLQTVSVLLFVVFFNIAVPERVDSQRRIGERHGGASMQKDLIEYGVISEEQIPEELRFYHEKTIHIESDLSFTFYELSLFRPALVLQIVVILFHVVGFVRARGSSSSG